MKLVVRLCDFYNISTVICICFMEILAKKLFNSVQPIQSNLRQQKFLFFTPSKTAENEINETELKRILDILSLENTEKSQIEATDQNEESEYKSIKNYISYLVTTRVNEKSAKRLGIILEGLDSLTTVPLNAKHNTLQLLLLLSIPKKEQNSQTRPVPLPYSDGTQTFSLYADNYFDVIPSDNNLLFSNTKQLENNSASNISLDSGYFSLPSLPSMKYNGDKKQSILDNPNAHSILSKYSGNKHV